MTTPGDTTMATLDEVLQVMEGAGGPNRTVARTIP